MFQNKKIKKENDILRKQLSDLNKENLELIRKLYLLECGKKINLKNIDEYKSIKLGNNIFIYGTASMIQNYYHYEKVICNADNQTINTQFGILYLTNCSFYKS